MNHKKLRSLILIFAVILLCACGKKTAAPDAARQIHTKAQAAYLEGAYTGITKYAKGEKELSIPEPVELQFKGITAPFTVYISENQDMSDAVQYESKKDTAKIYNLKIGTKYFYYARSGNTKTEVSSFQVEDVAPRNLYIDGVTNVRDLGGWKTSSGKSVKQGAIFRSGKFNYDLSADKTVTEQGIKAMKELGVKTEIDLRQVDNGESGYITESPLGSDVKYVSVPLDSGGNNILLNKEKLKLLFSVFGKEENYPIVFHCSIGTDRTGMLAFLINGLLGVSDEDLYRDFLFSNFGNIGGMRTQSIITTYIDTVDLAKGNTLSEKIENYLISVGVNAGDLAVLKRMMTE